MFDQLVTLLRQKFTEVKDPRRNNQSYSLSNMLSIAFAMFSLKDSSLSSFREQFTVRSQNLKQVYGVEVLCGDTALREAIDLVKSSDLQALFIPLIDQLREKKVLTQREVLGGYTLISVDGTGHYSSCGKGCPQCLEKHHRSGKVTYYHQLLGAVLVHPDEKTVFPVACEAIVKQDGETKNDCELNACKRLIPQITTVLPDEKLLGVFDALYANGPHIRSLQAAHIRYIIGTKGATSVDKKVKILKEEGAIEKITWIEQGIEHTIYFINGLPLNDSHPDIKTNYFEYKAVNIETGEVLFYSTWITDIVISTENVKELVDCARARWKIENETFNTLKNQGYHLEHNYGHGKKYLATNFAILTFLAFLVDQMAQQLDKHFQIALAACKTFKLLWQIVRAIFYLIPVKSMDAVYRFIALKKQVNMPALE